MYIMGNLRGNESPVYCANPSYQERALQLVTPWRVLPQRDKLPLERSLRQDKTHRAQCPRSQHLLIRQPSDGHVSDE